MSQTARGLRTVSLLLLLLLIGNVVLVFVVSQTLQMITKTAIATDEQLRRLEFQLEAMMYPDNYFDEVEPTVFYNDQIPLPYEIQQYIYDTCLTFDVDIALVLGLIETESAFDEQASGDGGRSAGLMQINQIHWSGLRESGQEPFDVYDNILTGVSMLSNYLHEYGDVSMALMVYNGGLRYAQSLWNTEVYSTTYTRKVSQAAEIWREILMEG